METKTQNNTSPTWNLVFLIPQRALGQSQEEMFTQEEANKTRGLARFPSITAKAYYLSSASPIVPQTSKTPIKQSKKGVLL
jgi:hypothetical protein